MYYNNNGMIKFVDFKKHVEAGVFDPVYAAIGDDAFLISSAVKMLERLVDMPEINSACYGDSSDIDAMILQYGQLPMMSGKKTHEVRNGEHAAENAGTLPEIRSS